MQISQVRVFRFSTIPVILWQSTSRVTLKSPPMFVSLNVMQPCAQLRITDDAFAHSGQLKSRSQVDHILKLAPVTIFASTKPSPADVKSRAGCIWPLE